MCRNHSTKYNKYMKRNKIIYCIVNRSMIISIDSPKKISICNIFILDAKRNMIMDGYFSKLIYSNELFTMTGLYILCPIDISTVENNGSKKQIKFNPYTQSNMQIIQDFSKLETRILEYYKQTKQNNRKIVNTLTRQLYSGYMKIYKDYNQNVQKTNEPTNLFLLKISGIWETCDSVGLTYKVYEVNENYISS